MLILMGLAVFAVGVYLGDNSFYWCFISLQKNLNCAIISLEQIKKELLLWLRIVSIIRRVN